LVALEVTGDAGGGEPRIAHVQTHRDVERAAHGEAVVIAGGIALDARLQLVHGAAGIPRVVHVPLGDAGAGRIPAAGRARGGPARRARPGGRDADLGAVAVVAVVAHDGEAAAGAGVAGVVRGARHPVVARAAARCVHTARRRGARVAGTGVPVVAVSRLALAHVRRQQAVLVHRAEIGIGAVRVAVAAERDGRVLAAAHVAAPVRRADVVIVAVGRRARPAHAGAARFDAVA